MSRARLRRARRAKNVDTQQALLTLLQQDGNRGEESHRSLISRSASLNLAK